MNKRVTILSLSLFAVLVISTVVTFLLRSEGGAAEERGRDFCWAISERVSSGESGKDESVSACAARLEKAAERDRSALRTEVVVYGPHVAKNPDAMPVPVRRALARALAERPSLVQESLAPVGPRKSGVARPYLDRKTLSATVRALAGDGVALRTLRTSQESYARSRIDTLTKSDFEKGMDSRRAVPVVESVSGATGTLTALAQGARQDATRGEREDYEERHGYTRVRDQLEARARAVGVRQSEIEDVTSSLSDFKLAASNAYDQAARAAGAAAESS